MAFSRTRDCYDLTGDWSGVKVCDKAGFRARTLPVFSRRCTLFVGLVCCQPSSVALFKMAEKIITLEEVAKHKDSKSGVWIIIHGKVYDVTKFLEEVCVHYRTNMLLFLVSNLKSVFTFKASRW